MRTWGWQLTTLAAVVVASCATPLTAGSDFDPTIDFDRFGTFAFGEPDDLPVGDPRLENNPFFADRLHEAVRNELQRRGIRESETTPGLLIHHHTSVRNHIEVYEADLAAGYESDEFGRGTQVIEYEEGTFLIDIADAQTKQILWRGWAIANVEHALNDPAAMDELLGRAMRRMFEQFPVEPIM